ncbi:type II toxin-antitoxin system RelE/ParE family toxin [Inquilinus sp. NPDC058860]|uniref:type II toxin-antitoxin system RelE/ParE family toxin n=1 Tax=Inquilinus sp. NPDC058860 TaxID=3346652 RepID=UPI0036996A8F
MRSLRYTSAALDDIADIAAYVAETSSNIELAEGFAGQLLDKCEKLAALRGTLGRARPELRPDLRSIPFKSYVIFFRYLGDTFEVVNILEGHRDIDGYFHPGDE